MQIVRAIDRDEAHLVGFGMRVLLLSREEPGGPLHKRLSAMGARIETALELFSGLAAAIEDPNDYDLLVVDCDGFGGLYAGLRAFGMMGEVTEKLPVILISAQVATHKFADSCNEPTLMRGPISSVAARVGIEHALRGRMMLQYA